MKPYFHEYRSCRDIASGRTEHLLRKWYIQNPEPLGRIQENSEWLLWAAKMELEWESVFDREFEILMRECHHGRP